jgi:hypothetical protein
LTPLTRGHVQFDREADPESGQVRANLERPLYGSMQIFGIGPHGETTILSPAWHGGAGFISQEVCSDGKVNTCGYAAASYQRVAGNPAASVQEIALAAETVRAIEPLMVLSDGAIHARQNAPKPLATWLRETLLEALVF